MGTNTYSEGTMPPKLTLKRRVMVATPSRKVASQILKARLQDEPTDVEASGFKEDYPIGSDAPAERRNTQNHSKKMEAVPEPIGISTPPHTTAVDVSF